MKRVYNLIIEVTAQILFLAVHCFTHKSIYICIELSQRIFFRIELHSYFLQKQKKYL